MIIVLADDITGAAEIAGVCLEHQVSVSFAIDHLPEEKADVMVVCTDSRSYSEMEALQIHRAIVRSVNDDKVLFFKKCDSLLRGYVLTELLPFIQERSVRNIVLQPANPLAGRTIMNENYFFKGHALSETPFKDDPDFPAFTSDISVLLKNRNPLFYAEIRNSNQNIFKRLSDSDTSGPYDKLELRLSDALCVNDLMHESKQPADLRVGSAAFFEQFLLSTIEQASSGNTMEMPSGSTMETLPGDTMQMHAANSVEHFPDSTAQTHPGNNEPTHPCNSEKILPVKQDHLSETVKPAEVNFLLRPFDPESVLVVGGSFHPETLKLVDTFRMLPESVHFIPHELLVPPIDLDIPEAFIHSLENAYLKTGKIFLGISKAKISFPGSSMILTKRLSGIVRSLMKTIQPIEIFVSGGATAYDLLQSLEISLMLPVHRLSPGVVRFFVPSRNIIITLKPGSYPFHL